MRARSTYTHAISITGTSTPNAASAVARPFRRRHDPDPGMTIDAISAAVPDPAGLSSTLGRVLRSMTGYSAVTSRSCRAVAKSGSTCRRSAGSI